MKTDATEHKTNGRKTTNDVLITSFRAGVLAVLVLACAEVTAGR